MANVRAADAAGPEYCTKQEARYILRIGPWALNKLIADGVLSQRDLPVRARLVRAEVEDLARRTRPR